MLESEKKKLKEKSGRYLSIGITENGECVRSISVPWNSTANAFNMRTPDVYISAADTKDEQLLSALQEYEITGCYIFTPLTDHSFISRFAKVQDLYIADAHGLADLSFLAELPECRMLYVRDAVLDDIAVIAEQKKQKGGRYLCCAAFDGCAVRSLPENMFEGLFFSELIAIVPVGSGEKERWEKACPDRLTVYEYREKTE